MSGEYRYGDSGTIHSSGEVNVERDPTTGKVLAVWFRCVRLPFTDEVCGVSRAEDLKTYIQHPLPIKAIVFTKHPLEK